MNFGGDHPAPGHGKISPRCVPVLPAMARLCPDAFPGCRPWQDCPRCVPEGASDGKNASSRQYIAAMYSDSATFGKICVLCIRKAPQSAVGEYTARTSCRQGAFSPSEALKLCTAHESCHPPMDLALVQGLLPEQLHRGIVFQLPGPCAGMPAPAPRQHPPPANARHLPIPAARRAHHSQGQADELRWRSFGAWPEVRPSPEGPPTASSRRAGRQRDAAQNRAWIPKWAQNRRRRPQARPVLRQHC